ncbi:protease inhibitor I42 family protein [Bacillus cereus]
MSHSQPVVILTQKDQGKAISLPIGQLFSIQLIENPTTGYRWTVCNISGVHLLAETFHLNSISEGVSGHGEYAYFNFNPYMPASIDFISSTGVKGKETLRL